VALSADPLDELIADLERSLPGYQPLDRPLPYEVFVLWSDIVLYGSADDLRLFEASPDGELVKASFARLGSVRR
jgi:hypothetical protein